jgi:putative ABC transport system substrate-binding protein
MLGSRTNRREFIAALGSAAAWPLVARGQQAGKVWRIGSLSPASSGQNDNLKAFMQALNDLGYIDGKNIHFERRVADGNLDRLPVLAAELVRTNVDLILAESSFAVEAARAAKNNSHCDDRRRENLSLAAE